MKRLATVAALFTLVWAQALTAETPPPPVEGDHSQVDAVDLNIDNSDPYRLVVDSTEQLLAVAREARGYYDEDPERYYQQVGTLVEAIVDLERFTRGVMATYASVRRYRALETREEKEAFLARIDRFGTTLKDNLIRTYSKALLNFEGQRIETEQPTGADLEDRFARVTQRIYGPDDTPYRVQYFLRLVDEGIWKLYNISVEGINLGKVFRSQFAAAVERNRGDVDATIDNWEDEQESLTIEEGEVKTK